MGYGIKMASANERKIRTNSLSLTQTASHEIHPQPLASLPSDRIKINKTRPTNFHKRQNVRVFNEDRAAIVDQSDGHVDEKKPMTIASGILDLESHTRSEQTFVFVTVKHENRLNWEEEDTEIMEPEETETHPYEKNENSRQHLGGRAGLDSAEINVNSGEGDTNKTNVCHTSRTSSSSRYSSSIYLKEQKCRFCPKLFKTVKQKNLHELRAHTGLTGENSFKCDFCDMAFAWKTHKLKHEQKHSREKWHECKYCDAKFAKTHEKNLHEYTHTGEKPYSCQLCGKCFGHPSSLSRHLHTHTNEKPYKCKICHKSFKSTTHLRCAHQDSS